MDVNFLFLESVTLCCELWIPSRDASYGRGFVDSPKSLDNALENWKLLYSSILLPIGWQPLNHFGFDPDENGKMFCVSTFGVMQSCSYAINVADAKLFWLSGCSTRKHSLFQTVGKLKTHSCCSECVVPRKMEIERKEEKVNMAI